MSKIIYFFFKIILQIIFKIILLPFRIIAWIFNSDSNPNAEQYTNTVPDVHTEVYSNVVINEPPPKQFYSPTVSSEEVYQNYDLALTHEEAIEIFKVFSKNILIFIIISISIYIFFNYKRKLLTKKKNKDSLDKNSKTLKEELTFLSELKKNITINNLIKISNELISKNNLINRNMNNCLVLKYVFKKKQLKTLNEIHKKTFDLSTIKILIKEMESLEKKLEFDQIESSIISELSNGKNLELEKNILAESKIIENKENETHLLAKIFSTTWFNERAIKKHSQELQKLKKEIQSNQEYLSKRLSSEQKLKSEMDEISKKLQVEINLLLEFLIAKNESFIKEMGS